MPALTEHDWDNFFRENHFFAPNRHFWMSALHNYGGVNILTALNLEHLFYQDSATIVEAMENLEFVSASKSVPL